MFGRMMNEPLGKAHFWLTFITYYGTFFPMHYIGIAGHMRRIYDPYQYEFLKAPAAHQRVHHGQRPHPGARRRSCSS